MKAQDLLSTIGAMSASENRDKLVVDAARKGGLREWEWVDVPVLDSIGVHIGTFRAQTDYVAIGDESDWVRVPVGGRAAQQIADFAGAILPSAYMVHLIWKAAPIKLRPVTFPQAGMTTTKRFVEHNERIEKQREGRVGLVAGIKKDTIVSNKLVKKPNATCIFGWHHPNGQIIQPISTAHDQPWYSDYSHGVRLIHPEMMVFGETCRVQDVLRDPDRAAILTGAASWRDKYDGKGDDVLKVVRYGEPVVSQVPASYTPTPTNEIRPAGDLGQLALQWCVKELDSGVREEPLGSNSGPRIAEYFKGARRRATGKLLGISKGDWCAVAQCAALSAAAKIGAHVPHGYRAAVWELREDAKTTGAWKPAADVRQGRYMPRAGDLAVWTRGAGLGHVSRIESATLPEIVTIGANEGDGRWLRRTRTITDPTFEGIISYADFRPVLKLDNYDSNLAAAPIASSVHAPERNDETWAQRIFLTAWAREFDRPPTPQERQTILAIARHERHYGLAEKPEAGRGKHNWGGVQCSKNTHSPDECYLGGDKNLKGEAYPARFKIYKTDEDGAQHLIQLVTKRRPHVHEAMRRGDLFAVAREMGTPRTINGKLYRAYHETPVDKYYKALAANARIVARNLGESLAVDVAGRGQTTPTPSHTAILPASYVAPNAATTPRSRTQDGVRALVRSRQPGLERVVVGHELQAPMSNVLLQDVGETLGIVPANALPAPVVTGVGTSTNVKDYATRVDNYIRVLHTIIQEEMNKRPQPDGFPWNEWAAFRATWSETYFQIMHSFIPNFDDGVVRTYDILARQWAEVVKGHYGRSPEQPLLDPPTSVAAKALWAVTGLAAAGMLVYAVTSTRR